MNPFVAKGDSEFGYVQPITFESMRVAQRGAGADVKVELLAACMEGESVAVPEGFVATAPLTRTVRDLLSVPAPPLPLIADLIQRLYDSTDAEWLIYTNVDIALQPHFYAEVARYIRQGHDALIINRRRIPGHYRSVGELPLMYGEHGKKHPGFDCFVFHRDLVPQFVLDQVCIGIPFIEILFSQNLFCHAKNFLLVDKAHLTFHIGEEVFKPRFQLAWLHNRHAFWRAVGVLWPKLDTRKFPWGRQWLPVRVIRWGLHPCIPIRLVVRLEWRRVFGGGSQ